MTWLHTPKEFYPSVLESEVLTAEWLVNANLYREDRLRALGNGVLPLVAGFAFVKLMERAR